MEVDAAAPVAPFVQQLFKLVHEGLHVAWAADGAALAIPDPTKFAADRCPVYFKHSNWTSFARMLNMSVLWGVWHPGAGRSHWAGGCAGSGSSW